MIRLLTCFNAVRIPVYDEYGIREINDSRVNVTFHKHRFLSNPQKEALISVAPLGGLVSWFPVTVAYNQMGFR